MDIVKWRDSKQPVFLKTVLATAVIATTAPAAQADLEETGDVLQLLIPIAAYGKTWLDDDEEGRMQFYKAGATTFGIVHGIKATAQKLRPNANNRSSFPSGHTASAFMGAAFFHRRYGWEWGLPSYALASVVGYSRVDSQNHFADDVLAGGNIAVMTSLFFVSPHDSDVQISPFQQDGANGITLSVNEDYFDKQKTMDSADLGNLRYSFSFGPTYMIRNIVKIPSSAQGGIDLDGFNGGNEPLTTAMSSFEYAYSDKHHFTGSFIPYEQRDVDLLTQPVQMGTVTFPAATEVVGRFRFYETTAGYEYQLVDNDDWTVGIGADLLLQRTIVEFLSSTDTEGASDWTVMALPSASIDYKISHRLSLTSTVAAADYSNNRVFSATAGVRWQLDKHWDIGLKAARYDRRIDGGDLENNFRVESYLVDLGYRF